MTDPRQEDEAEAAEIAKLRAEPWFKNVPDWMGEVVVRITVAKDAATKLLAKLDERQQAQDRRDELQEQRDQKLRDREDALLRAVEDMKQFANRIYGPDSELTKIHQKLGALESAGIARDKRYADRFETIDANQTRIKDDMERRVTKLEESKLQTEKSLQDLSERVLRLEERKSA